MPAFVESRTFDTRLTKSALLRDFRSDPAKLSQRPDYRQFKSNYPKESSLRSLFHLSQCFITLINLQIHPFRCIPRDFVPLWWALLIPHAELSCFSFPLQELFHASSNQFHILLDNKNLKHSWHKWTQLRDSSDITLKCHITSKNANIPWKCKLNTCESIRNMFQTFFICRTSTEASQKPFLQHNKRL